MKNAVIGNNKQKANLIVLGAVPRYLSDHLSTSTPSQFLLLMIYSILCVYSVHL